MSELASLKQQVVDRVHACYREANEAYAMQMPIPDVVFDLRGHTHAGFAVYSKYLLRFNIEMLATYGHDYIEDTVPHEVAHLVVYAVNGMVAPRLPNGKVDHHGEMWKAVMHLFNAKPTRCHNYHTDTQVVKANDPKYHVYRCSKCNHHLRFTNKRHQMLTKNPMSVYHVPCKGHALIHVSSPAPRQRRALAPHTIGNGTFSQCYRLFENFPGYTRPEMINVFVQECNIKPATASAYYNRCQHVYRAIQPLANPA